MHDGASWITGYARQRHVDIRFKLFAALVIDSIRISIGFFVVCQRDGKQRDVTGREMIHRLRLSFCKVSVDFT
jgi:hypothetical protein